MKKFLTVPQFEFIIFLCVCVILLVSFKQIDFLLIPSFLLVLLWLIYHQNSKIYNIDIVDLALILLFLFEIVNYLYSPYQANSYLFFREFIVIFQIILLTKYLFKEYKYQLFISLFISLIALLSSNIGFRQFIYKYFEAEYYGFSDFTYLRFLNSPMGFLSNEWGTIMLTFIPFLFSCLLFLNKKNQSEDKVLSKYGVLNTIIILACTCTLLNLFITFSRGIYLALLVYILLFNLFSVFYKVKYKKFLLMKNIFLLTIFLGSTLYFHSTISSVIYSNTGLDRSSNGRVGQWQSTIDIVKAYPLLGIGSKNYSLINNTYIKENPDTFFTGRVNNTFIQILTEKGVVGIIVYLSLFLIFIYYSHRKIISSDNDEKNVHIIILSSVCAILVRELFFSSILYNSGLLLLMFILFLINVSGSKVVLKLSKKQIKWMIILIILPFMIFLINKELVLRKEKNQLEILTKLINIRKFEAALMCINKFEIGKSKNSLLISTCGLIYERNAINTLNNNQSIYDLKYKDSILLDKAKFCYLKSISINPFDDIYYHNLAWLYFKSGQIESANMYIQKAIQIMPNSSLYYVTYGFFLEKYDINEAVSNYKKAIELSPDITNSCFFNKMILRLSLNRDKFIIDIVCNMKKYQGIKYSTIVQARLGKLLLDLNDTNSARSVFIKVSKELPNLSRPLFYLGYIYHVDGDDIAMLACYNKAIFLDSKDYLPRQCLALYYKNKGDTINEKYYSKTALMSFENKASESSRKSNRKYFQNIVQNDLIPYGLLQELKSNSNEFY